MQRRYAAASSTVRKSQRSTRGRGAAWDSPDPRLTSEPFTTQLPSDLLAILPFDPKHPLTTCRAVHVVATAVRIGRRASDSRWLRQGPPTCLGSHQGQPCSLASCRRHNYGLSRSRDMKVVALELRSPPVESMSSPTTKSAGASPSVPLGTWTAQTNHRIRILFNLYRFQRQDLTSGIESEAASPGRPNLAGLLVVDVVLFTSREGKAATVPCSMRHRSRVSSHGPGLPRTPSPSLAKSWCFVSVDVQPLPSERRDRPLVPPGSLSSPHRQPARGLSLSLISAVSLWPSQVKCLQAPPLPPHSSLRLPRPPFEISVHPEFPAHALISWL